MIKMKDEYKFAVENHFVEWCRGGTCFIQKKCQKLNGPIFEELLFTTFQDRYDLIWILHVYNKQNDKSNYKRNFGGEIPLPAVSTINPPIFLCVSINFIYTWVNDLAKILCGVFLSIKIRWDKSLKKSTEKPTPILEYIKRKCQILLTDIGG